MKNLKLYFLIIFTLSVTYSCGSKKTSMGEGVVKINKPCFGDKFFDTKKSFYGSGQGEATLSVAARMAADVAAMSELTSDIEAVVKSVTQQSLNLETVNSNSSASLKVNNISTSAAKNAITGRKKVCEQEGYRSENKRYLSYIAYEISTEPIVKNLFNTISKDESLKLRYDYIQMKKVFDEEMDDLKSNN